MRFTRIGFAAALLLSVVMLGAQRQADVERQLKTARNTELVDGDLKGAIEQYKKVAASGIRPLAAEALLRMADAYRLLGETEAQRIYQQIVRDYSDQNDAAAAARARLASAPPPTASSNASGDRVVWTGETVFGDGDVSPDGRYITDIAYGNDGYLNLFMHDVSTGKDRLLTDLKDWNTGSVYTSAFSRDGKQVAYGWRTYDTNTNELRVVRVDGTGVPQPRRIYTNDQINVFYAKDWSPDGKWLAITARTKDRAGLLALVGVDDGSFKVLKTMGWRIPSSVEFSPDGQYLAYDLPSSEEEPQYDIYVMKVDASRESRVVENRSHDTLMGWSPDGANLIFGSSPLGSLGMWAAPVQDGKARGPAVLLKPNTGLISPLGITASGGLYVTKDTSTVGIHVAPIDLSAGRLTGPAALEGFAIYRPTWSQDGRQLAYILANEREVMIAIRSVDSGEVRELRPALLYVGSLQFFPDGRSFIASGRDLKGRNGIFKIEADSGGTTFIAEGTGRPKVSPDGKEIYYASAGALVGHNLASGRIRAVYRIPQGGAGEAELSPDGRFIAMVASDPGTRASRLLVVFAEGGEPREVRRWNHPTSVVAWAGLTWTPDSNSVVVLKATGEQQVDKELWLVPITGGEGRKLDVPLDEWTTNGIRLHPNGRQIAFFKGKTSREAWVIQNLMPKSKTP